MPKKKSDPIERSMEAALEPGSFVADRRSWDFVDDLEEVKDQIERLLKTHPRRAVGLCETFIAACYEKADEIDDSGGSFGMLVENLFCLWIKARQGAKADPHETVRQLLHWMDHDDYGFCHGIEKDAAKTFNRAGLEAFGEIVRGEFEKELAEGKVRENGDKNTSGGFRLRRLSDVLRTIYAEEGDAESYLAVAQEMGLTPLDCEAIARISRKRRKPDEALAWVERGLQLEAEKDWVHGSSHELPDMKRELLKKLGRGADALEAAWKDFRAYPSADSYKMLMRYVPKAEKAGWHGKALEAAKGAGLSQAIELYLATKEWDRLSALVRDARPNALAGISHYRAEPAARNLERRDPVAAAKLYRALGLRILQARSSKKSQYYNAALGHFGKARKIFLAARREGEWQSLVDKVRTEHRRKTGFMSDFEAIVSQGSIPRAPSFLEKARKRKERHFRPS